MGIEDKLNQAKGALKEGAGKLTGDKKTEVEGAVEKVVAGDEGLEGRYINLTGGTVDITAGDDGINATEWTTKDSADTSSLTNSTSDLENEVVAVVVATTFPELSVTVMVSPALPEMLAMI